MMRTLPTCICVLLLAAACTQPGVPTTRTVVISVVGTNDVHGNLSQREDRGGLTTLSGYVGALRSLRSEDGGAVLLIDAGDMWQGTLESNMTEGAAIVAAYNALNYTAATIGNHEFDFGPLGPAAIPGAADDDPRGALKQRATEADFPMLAANLIDAATNAPVNWPNVRPSVMVEVQGIKIGIVGVMSRNALRATIAANVVGLRVAPLATTIEGEARRLRAAGADLIVVTAHAGGRCADFEDPLDLSSCNQAGEIFAVARSLPAGLVDHIIAGHVHQGIAHLVNGTAITSSYSNTVAFSRVDFTFDDDTHRIVARRVFQPTPLAGGRVYEGRTIGTDPSVVAIAARAARFTNDQKNRSLGIHLETPFTLEGNPESTLGNLFTDALLDSIDADIAIHNVAGGLRRDLPQGDLTYGSVYEMSPFENRVVVVDLNGNQLRGIVAAQARRGARAIGFTGMRVSVSCEADRMTVTMRYDDGREIRNDDQLKVIVNDYIALGGDGILANLMPDDGFKIDVNMPLTRTVFIEWLVDRGGAINAHDYDTRANPKWDRTGLAGRECR